MRSTCVSLFCFAVIHLLPVSGNQKGYIVHDDGTVVEVDDALLGIVRDSRSADPARPEVSGRIRQKTFRPRRAVDQQPPLMDYDDAEYINAKTPVVHKKAMFEQYQRSKSAPYLRFGKRSDGVEQEAGAPQNVIKKVAGRSKLDSPGFFYPIFVTFRNNL